ncbi:hypothetical protein ACH47B_36560 [Rhodococcus sp. NPDC019627]|uniref:hypothetical protein n=1 Tax=unclassified Rhodococcus (in: high G+C Gram-positive bacteria) TaxID=192944 RepID=UPI003411BE55
MFEVDFSSARSPVQLAFPECVSGQGSIRQKSDGKHRSFAEQRWAVGEFMLRLSDDGGYGRFEVSSWQDLER